MGWLIVSVMLLILADASSGCAVQWSLTCGLAPPSLFFFAVRLGGIPGRCRWDVVGYGVSGFRTLSPSAKAMVTTTWTSPFVTLGANVVHQGTRNLRQSFAHGFKRHRIIR